eukprot:2145960-Amphidinium_carterae.1
MPFSNVYKCSNNSVRTLCTLSALCGDHDGCECEVQNGHWQLESNRKQNYADAYCQRKPTLRRGVNGKDRFSVVIVQV